MGQCSACGTPRPVRRRRVFNAGAGQIRVTGVGFVPGTTWIAGEFVEDRWR